MTDPDLAPGAVLHRYVGAFVDAMARAGIAQVCLCPGSRSTPLALEFQRHPAIRVWVHLDERSAAFFALGIAKATGKPVALLSTSGTAALNFAPAVAEARYGRVPLLVLTADRPPELRDVGANQTIDQIRLFGSMVKRSVEVALPEATPQMLRYVDLTAARAVAVAEARPAGPVHLNLPFREPLIPSAPPGADRDAPRPRSAVVHHAGGQPDGEAVAAAVAHVSAGDRGLIVCGPQADPHFPQAVAWLAATLGLPLLADPLSQVRCGPHDRSRVIAGYDAFLRDAETARALRPDFVLRFGATPTSKPLLQFLDDPACPQWLITDGEGWNDPTLAASTALHADARALCDALTAALPPLDPAARGRREAWHGRWRTCAAETAAVQRDLLARDDGISEPRVFTELADLLPDGATLFVGNSMPVRDLDGFYHGGARALRVLGNRGSSGIDGVVSTALGAAAAGPGPLVLVIGDLSLYHDLNGLFAVKRHDLHATIVLINNDGGGIFSFLPQADEVEDFEQLFGTPHGLDFRHAAALYGLDHRPVRRAADFRDAVAQSLGKPGVALVEVQTERAANAALHREIWQAVAARVRGALHSNVEA